MLRLGCLLFVVSLAWLAACQPIDSEEGGVRVARSPLPARMTAGMAGMYRGRSYEHQGLVAAGTLAAGPYYGGRRSQQVNQGEEEEERPVEDETQEDDAAEEEEEERKPKVSRQGGQAPRRPAPAPAAPEADDEDDEDAAPARRGGRRNQNNPSTYSNFFPIVFGSTSGGSRRRSEDEGVSGGSNPGLTAISNSFSTGRGAVASSNANAYGGRAPAVDAAPTQYRQSSPSRYRS